MGPGHGAPPDPVSRVIGPDLRSKYGRGLSGKNQIPGCEGAVTGYLPHGSASRGTRSPGAEKWMSRAEGALGQLGEGAVSWPDLRVGGDRAQRA